MSWVRMGAGFDSIKGAASVASWSHRADMDAPTRFEIQALSDEDYEDLIVEVLYDGEFCFLVSQEQGFENLRVAVQPRRNGEAWDFSMDEIEADLKRAAELLWELRQVQE